MIRETDFFIVASRGLTATTWFSQALNKHPLIFCCHGRDRPVRGPETKELLQSKQYRDDRLDAEQRQRKMSIPDYFDTLIRASSGQKILGNVHGFVLVELLDKLAKAGIKENIPIANMVRNPITFIASYTALVCHRQYDYPEKFAAEHLPRAEVNREFLQKLAASESENVESLGFVEACQALLKMSSEIDRENIPLIKMERIVAEPDYFSEIAGYLTKGKCRFDEELLIQIFSQQKLNSHRGKDKSAGIEENKELQDESLQVWKSWPGLKKRIFKKIISRETINKFISIGYDLSFI
ncbi:MAG: hypothetical protein R6X10_07880 [Desulfobacterales bacterium]